MKQNLLSCLALALLMGAAGTSSSQEKSVKPGINKTSENPSVKDFQGKFEVESREIFARRKEIVKACKLKPGMVVADVGAGTGFFTRLLAKAVGEKGQVYAVDIAPTFVKHIKNQCEEARIKNVTGVVCSQTSVKLPAGSIDVAFICATYHHFEYPFKTMASIHDALRPGGRVVLVDMYRVPGKSSAWIMGHVRAGKEVFVKECVASGFQVIAEDKQFKDFYLVQLKKVAPRISAARKDDNGILVHTVQSEFQGGKTEIRVLLPERMKKGRRYSVVYVLPVEARTGHRYGNGLLEVKKLDLHNKHELIVVQPTFSHLPWYADHPTDPLIRQETYFLSVVVPFVERNYPAGDDIKGRLLLGFSKSGFGAFTLLLRHPTVFGKAVAWDSPLNMAGPTSFGMGPIYGTQENFERYRIPELLKKHGADLGKTKRLGLAGHANFGKHHHAIHALMLQRHIPHAFLDKKQTKHHWNAGWLPDAIRFLVDNE